VAWLADEGYDEHNATMLNLDGDAEHMFLHAFFYNGM